MAIYLGSTQISSNPTGTGKLILGTQNICKAYLGSTLIFDNCATPNSNVQLNITNNISGPSAGYTIGGNLAGFTKSGQPGDSYFAFQTTASVNSGYSGSITVSNAPGGTFPSPGGTTVNATTTLSGSVTANVTTHTDTINVNLQPSLSGSVSVSPTTFSGTPGTNYTVTVTFTPAPHFTYSNLIATDSGSSSSVSLTSNGAGGFSGTLSYTIGNSGQTRDINVTGTQAPVLYEYDFNISENLSGTGASAVYTVTGGNNQYTNQPLSGAVTITTEGYHGDSVSASVTANLQSGYQWSVTPNPNPDSYSGTFNDGNSPQTLNVTGTAQSNPCANATTAFHASVGEPNLNSFCSVTTFSTNLFYHNGTAGQLLPGSGNVVCQGSGANKSLVNGGNNYYITGTSAFNYSGTGSFTYMRLNTSGTVTASGSYYCY